MIGLIARMPDKAQSRTVHNFTGAGFSQCGAAWALRLLKPIRGLLLEHSSDDQRLYAASCWQPRGGVAIALHNADREAKTVELALANVLPADHGEGKKRKRRKKKGDGTVTRLALGEEDALTIVSEKILIENKQLTCTLAPLETAVYRIHGLRIKGSATRHEFHAAEGALVSPADGSVTVTVELPAKILSAATEAGLRLALVGAKATGAVSCNDQAISSALTQVLPVTDHPLALDQLKSGANQLTVALPDGARLGSLSLLLRTIGD